MTPEPIKQTAPPLTVTLDWSKLEQHITEIQEHLKKFEGKPGYNCFIYYNKFVQPFVNRYIEGERTVELYKQIIAIPIEDPLVNKLGVFIPGIVGLPKDKFNK